MPNIEFLYFPDCPNVDAARNQLRDALLFAGLTLNWTEHDVTAADCPARMQGYGSPTILVDGRDVAGGSPGDGSSCRVYAGSELLGVPPLAVILAALRPT